MLSESIGHEESMLSEPEQKIHLSVAEKLQISPEEIKFTNLEGFIKGDRYAYFFTKQCFGKIAKEPNHKLQLAREVSNTLLAQDLGFDTTGVSLPYSEIDSEHGMVVFDKLSSEDGSAFVSYEDISGLSDEEAQKYGSRSAQTLMSHGFAKLPSDEDATRFLHRGAEGWSQMVDSPESLKNGIDQRRSFIDYPGIVENLQQVVGDSVDVAELAREFSRLPQLIDLLIEHFPKQDDEYFVHNDAGIQNIFFRANSQDGQEPDLMIDFEAASATHYPILGLIRDIQQYFGKVWANPDLQKQFIKGCFDWKSRDNPDLNEPNNRYYLLRAAIELGSLHFSHFPLKRVVQRVEQDHGPGVDSIKSAIDEEREMDLPLSLLKNLPENLKYLDDLYQNEQ
jgi:hypothetical protein